jgi:hypothetical protein
MSLTTTLSPAAAPYAGRHVCVPAQVKSRLPAAKLSGRRIESEKVARSYSRVVMDARLADVRDEIAEVLNLLVATGQAERDLGLVVHVVLGNPVHLHAVLCHPLLQGDVALDVVQRRIVDVDVCPVNTQLLHELELRVVHIVVDRAADLCAQQPTQIGARRMRRLG